MVRGLEEAKPPTQLTLIPNMASRHIIHLRFTLFPYIKNSIKSSAFHYRDWKAWFSISVKTSFQKLTEKSFPLSIPASSWDSHRTPWTSVALFHLLIISLESVHYFNAHLPAVCSTRHYTNHCTPEIVRVWRRKMWVNRQQQYKVMSVFKTVS